MDLSFNFFVVQLYYVSFYRNQQKAYKSPIKCLQPLTIILLYLFYETIVCLLNKMKLSRIMNTSTRIISGWPNVRDTASVDRTIRKLFSRMQDKVSANLRCVHGIRVISPSWVIGSHSYAYLDINSFG